MKRYKLFLAAKPDQEALESLVALHEGKQQIILTYGDLYDPKAFTKTLLKYCQTPEVYRLEDENPKVSTSPKANTYMLLGINDKARILCLKEQNSTDTLELQNEALIHPRSFHLSWDKSLGFKVEWA